MKRCVLVIAALLAALPAAAQRAMGIHCPQGAEAKFTGSPIKPLICVQVSSAAVTVQAPAPPPPPAPLQGANLKDLDGRWDGFVAAGVERFELLLTVQKKGWLGKSLSLQLETKGHSNPLSQIFLLELKPESEDAYSAVVRLETAQVPALKAKVSLGKAADPAYDRELLLLYKDGSAHRLQLKRDKDTLRYSYHDLAHPERSTQGELKATQRKTL